MRTDAWAGLVFSAFIPAGIANVVVFSAIRLLGPTRITAFQFLVPFMAVLMGAAFLAEPVRLDQLLGGLVIVIGVAIARTDRVTAFGGWLAGAPARLKVRSNESRLRGAIPFEPATQAGEGEGPWTG